MLGLLFEDILSLGGWRDLRYFLRLSSRLAFVRGVSR
jgi:hypothetical protein